MKYEEIIAGVRALKAEDFDYMNVSARGSERLAELTDALMSAPDAEKAIPELFAVMERLPNAHLGSPGPLVHTLGGLQGYEKRTCPLCSTPAITAVRMDGQPYSQHRFIG
jgi:hypothetical protein